MKNFDVAVERNIMRNLLQNEDYAKEVFIYDTINADYFTDVFLIDAFLFTRGHYRKYGTLPDGETFVRGVTRKMTRVEKYKTEDIQRRHWQGAAKKMTCEITAEEKRKVEANADELQNLWTARNIQAALVEAEQHFSAGDNEAAMQAFQFALILGKQAETIISDGELFEDFENIMQLHDARARGDIQPMTSGIRGVQEIPGKEPVRVTLDDLLAGGYYPGELVVYVGDNNIGKSTALMETAYANYALGRFVLFVTIEMVKDAQQMRVYSRASGIPFAYFRQGKLTKEHKSKLHARLKKFKERGGLLHVTALDGSVTVSMIEEKMREVEARYGRKLDMVVVDYINDMKPEGNNKDGKDWAGLGEISWSMISLAKRWHNRRGVPIVSANQRKTTAFGEKGQLQDAAFSPLVTQHAAVVITLSRGKDDKELDRIEWTIVKGRFARKDVSFYTYPRLDISLISSAKRIKEEVMRSGYDD